MVFVRVTAWCVLSGLVMITGAAVHGHARLSCWAAAIAIDLVGAAVGFYVPGLDRSATTDWAIEGGHFAERCQGFVLIALGESIVVTGSILAGGEHLSAHLVGAALVRVRRGGRSLVGVLRPGGRGQRCRDRAVPTTRAGSAARRSTGSIH